MNTIEKKMNIIEWLLHLEDRTILKKIERLLEYGVDSWDKLTKSQQAEIDEAIEELERGKGISHSTLMTKLRGR